MTKGGNIIKNSLQHYKKHIILLAFLLFLFCGFLPKKTVIHKTLNCSNITVTVTGVYYSYLLKNDCFEGTIDIADKTYIRKYTLRDDLYGNFVDDYGQPTYSFLQFKKFDYISGSDGNYDFTSEWNTDWNKEYQIKQKWNHIIHQFKHFIMGEG